MNKRRESNKLKKEFKKCRSEELLQKQNENEEALRKQREKYAGEKKEEIVNEVASSKLLFDPSCSRYFKTKCSGYGSDSKSEGYSVGQNIVNQTKLRQLSYGSSPVSCLKQLLELRRMEPLRMNHRDRASEWTDCAFHFHHGLAGVTSFGVTYENHRGFGSTGSKYNNITWSPSYELPQTASIATKDSGESFILISGPRRTDGYVPIALDCGRERVVPNTLVWNTPNIILVGTETGLVRVIVSQERITVYLFGKKRSELVSLANVNNPSDQENSVLLCGMRNGSIMAFDSTAHSQKFSNIGKLPYCVDHLQKCRFNDNLILAQDMTGYLTVFDIRKPESEVSVLCARSDNRLERRKFWISPDEKLIAAPSYHTVPIGREHIQTDYTVQKVTLPQLSFYSLDGGGAGEQTSLNEQYTGQISEEHSFLFDVKSWIAQQSHASCSSGMQWGLQRNHQRNSRLILASVAGVDPYASGERWDRYWDSLRFIYTNEHAALLSVMNSGVYGVSVGGFPRTQPQVKYAVPT